MYSYGTMVTLILCDSLQKESHLNVASLTDDHVNFLEATSEMKII